MSAQGRTWEVLGTEYYVYILDNQHNITHTLTQVSKQINDIDANLIIPFSKWFTSIPLTWPSMLSQ